MLKQRLVVTAAGVALSLLLLPRPSAAAGVWAPHTEPTTGFVIRIERWWNGVLSGADLPSVQKAIGRQGCGQDPNGQSAELCRGTGEQTEPAPVRSGR